MTIGDGPDDSEDEADQTMIKTLQANFRAMALDEDTFMPAIFVEDKDVLLPSTSSNTMDAQREAFATGGDQICTSAALENVFGSENRLFQPITAGTFVDEVLVEKPPKVVNVS